MSTLIIIGHVKDGVDLARQHNLPEPIIDLIEQHHGTTLVEYFYREAARRGEGNPDAPVVQESSFRYPGPKPQTKEAGILMVADAVESASRTLSEPTPSRHRGPGHGAGRQAAPRRPVRRVRPDPPRDRRDPREPDQVTDRHLSRPGQVSRATHGLSLEGPGTPPAHLSTLVLNRRPSRGQSGMNSDSEPGVRTPTSGHARRGPTVSTIHVEVSDSQRICVSIQIRSPRWSATSCSSRASDGPSSRSRWSTTPTIHEINRRHLAHDWPTDVITLPLSDRASDAGRRAGRLGRDGRDHGGRSRCRSPRRIGPVPGPRIATPVRLR